MSAFISALWKSISNLVMKYLIGVVTDSLYAWYERRKSAAKQKQKDQENKTEYDKAVKDGTDEQIENATEDYLNGD